MTPAILTPVAAYCLMSFFSVVVIRRRVHSPRLRTLTVVVGLLPLCQAAALLGGSLPRNWHFGGSPGDLVDSLMSLLCLFAVYLIDKESRDRKRADMRLRVAESETSPGAPKSRGAPRLLVENPPPPEFAQ
jgi:hypothetical protein